MPDNTIHLLQAAAARHHNAMASATDAIRRLDRSGRPITFQAVAAEAGVSRSWLYRNPLIRAQIEELRAGAAVLTPRPPSRERATRDSLRQQLEALRLEVAELRQQNRALRDHTTPRRGAHDGDMAPTQLANGAGHLLMRAPDFAGSERSPHRAYVPSARRSVRLRPCV